MKPTFSSTRSWAGITQFAAALALAGLIALPAHAALKTWIGTGGSGNWGTSGNWSPSGAPAAGDDLSFPAGATGLINTNNLTRNFSSIAFSGGSGGYILRGNPIALTNGLTAAHTAGLNTVELTITNGANQTVTATTGGTLALNGDIVFSSFTLTVNNSVSVNLAGLLSGSGGLTKNGNGNLLLNGAVNNTYTGTTTVNNGTLELNDTASATNMVPGDLTIGNSGTVLLSEGNQIADTANVTINGAGLFDMNSFSETVATLTFGGSGTASAGVGGILTVGNITANGASSSPTISGNLYLGTTTRTYNVTNAGSELTISAAISGGNSGSPFFIPAGFTKTGPGTLTLTASNSYGGPTTVNDGTLTVSHNKALGATGAAAIFNNPTTTVNNNGALNLNNAHITNEVLTLNSTNAGGALQDYSTGDWIGDITLSTSVVIEASSLFQLGGLISGPGGFTKIGASMLRMVGSDSNSYAGPTTVNVGSLELNRSGFDGCIPGDLVIGDGSGSDTVHLLAANQIKNTTHVSINFGGLLDLNNFIEGIGDLEFTGGAEDAGTSTLVLFNGGVTVNSHTNTATIDGNLSMNGQVRDFDVANGVFLNPDLQVNGPIVSGGIIKSGTGTLRLAGTNTYTGLTTVSNGTLEVTAPAGLGSTNSGTVLAHYGFLKLISVTVTGESLTNNTPYSYLETSGTTAWTGNVVLNAGFDVLVLGGSCNLSGVISGSGTFRAASTGTMTFSGASANTYTNTTTADTSITFQLNKSVASGAVLGDLTIGWGAEVQLLADNQIADTALLHVTNSGSSQGLFNLNGHTETTGAVDGAGKIDLGVGGDFRAGSGNGTSTFFGPIIGSGSLFKLGTGIWTLSGTNTYTGNTTVSAGTLLVNGVQPQSPITVNGTATLGGSGTAGNLFVFGNLRPGNSPGMLTCSNVVFNSSAADYYVELTGPIAGTDYDQLNVRGTNALASAVLHTTTAFTTPVAVGTKFTILNNDLVDAITGTFNGLAEGATITAGGYKFTISYVGNGGNDVVLNLTSVPGAVFAASVTSGNGNHAIDPNDCNNLALVITNTTGSPMTGVNATLSTTTPGVLITQPYSVYPNLAANGKGTNTTPFQISTLASFPCGTNINLQLSVDSSLGAFTMSFVLPSGESAAPTRFDNNNVTNCPDIGTIESTNLIAAWPGGGITKVSVSLWLVAPIDSDMSLSLISPDGTTVSLVSGVGAGANFGTSTLDASRTIFDDAAGTAITAGAAPFVGTFRPQGALTNFIGTTANGAWHLRVQDSFASGSADTLRAWSLFLSGTACAAGSGACDYCVTAISGSVTNTDLILGNRLARNLVVASCGSPKSYPFSTIGSYHYDAHTFTNTSASDACVTVLLTAPGNLQAGVYLNAFDPSNIATNYAADSGDSTFAAANLPQTCSATIPAGGTFIVTVNEITAGVGSSYTLQLSGLPCPPPVLSIQPVPTNKARLFWPSWAGGYLLEATPSLAPTNWTSVTNEPLVSALKYNVTNGTVTPTNRFYRLHKP